MDLTNHQKQNPIIFKYLGMLDYYLAIESDYDQLLNLDDLIIAQDVIYKEVCKHCSREKQKIANELYHTNRYSIKYYLAEKY